MKRFCINLVVVMLTLVVMGVLKLPWEIKVEKEMREDSLLPPKIDIVDKNSIGQAGYAAALGGFRDVLASYYYLKAHNLSAYRNYYEMERHFSTVVKLQPRSEYYWYMSAYYIWGGAASSMRDNYALPPIDRFSLNRKYVKRGEEILENGLKYNPQSYKIAMDKVRLETDHFRYPEYETALVSLKNILKNCKINVHEELQSWGQYAYTLAAIGGNEKLALEETKGLFKFSELGQRVPSQRLILYVLQDALMMPMEKRIPEEEIFFDIAEIEDFLGIYSYKARVVKSDKEAAREQYAELKEFFFRRNSRETDKSDVMIAKLGFLEDYLEMPGEQRISTEKLYRSAKHQAYVKGMILYRERIEQAASKDIVGYASSLLMKFNNGTSSQAERDELALISLYFENQTTVLEFPSLERLKYSKSIKYKMLYAYWKGQNNLSQKILAQNISGYKIFPMINVVRKIQILEEELDIPEHEKIQEGEVFTGLPY